MANTQLRYQRIDRGELHARSPASIAQLGRLDMILAIRNEQRQGRKPVDDSLSVLGSGEPLEKLLQHDTGDDDGLAGLHGFLQGIDLRLLR